MGGSWSRPERWVEAIKLACITTGIGALQFIRWQLARAEAHDRERERQRRRERRGLFGSVYEDEGDTARDRKGLVGGMPEGMRQAALHLIDYQLTPMLVDQWRMALVQVLFESHPGPAIPESDPELRAVLLDSLKTYEREEAQRPAFGGQPHIPVPEASSSAGRPSSSASDAVSAAAQRAQRAEAAQHRAEAATASRHAEQTNSSSSAVSSSYPSAKHAEPSAPPSGGMAPDQAEASAPPMPVHVAQAYGQQSSSAQPPEEQPPDVECHICMDAEVEVESLPCKHRMCIACAKAVCSMPDHAPQCPFCRAAITRLLRIAPAA